MVAILCLSESIIQVTSRQWKLLLKLNTIFFKDLRQLIGGIFGCPEDTIRLDYTSPILPRHASWRFYRGGSFSKMKSNSLWCWMWTLPWFVVIWHSLVCCTYRLNAYVNDSIIISKTMLAYILLCNILYLSGYKFWCIVISTYLSIYKVDTVHCELTLYTIGLHCMLQLHMYKDMLNCIYLFFWLSSSVY